MNSQDEAWGPPCSVERFSSFMKPPQLLTRNGQGRLDREKSAFDSVVETLRARAAELETANAAMERELHNGQQDTIAR